MQLEAVRILCKVNWVLKVFFAVLVSAYTAIAGITYISNFYWTARIPSIKSMSTPVAVAEEARDTKDTVKGVYAARCNVPYLNQLC